MNFFQEDQWTRHNVIHFLYDCGKEVKAEGGLWNLWYKPDPDVFRASKLKIKSEEEELPDWSGNSDEENAKGKEVTGTPKVRQKPKASHKSNR